MISSSYSKKAQEAEVPVVVVIQDDEDDDEEFPSKNDNSGSTNDLCTSNHTQLLSQEQQKNIQTFMEIMGLQDKEVAIHEMEKYDYDVQRAIDGWLRSSSRGLLTTAIKASSSLPFSNYELTISTTKTPVNHFVDSDFPPDSSSLDGRKQASQRQDEAASSSHHEMAVIRCFCGWVASAKTVQSEGPNYGRFYLACGKKAISSRPRIIPAVIDPLKPKEDTVATATTTKTTSPLKNPYRKDPSTVEGEKKMPSVQTRKNKTEVNSDNNKSNSCNFFKWDTVDGSLGSTCCGYNSKIWSNKFSWHWFPPPAMLPKPCQPVVAALATKYVKSGDAESFWFLPKHVRQGAVGNCWFLSALAVVAEHPYLLQQILGSSPTISNTVTTTTTMTTTRDVLAKGGMAGDGHVAESYQINLHLDGQWTLIVVDSYLPVVAGTDNKASSSTGSSTNSRKRRRDGIMVHDHDSSTKRVVPAFCDVPIKGTMLWPALIEKAYAKAHGCYANLSGGFIAEAFADLTGAPTETIIFQNEITSADSVDQLWARLLSFTDAGFLMGVATSQGGDGLVGGHAYSILGVIEIHDCLVGEQQKVTDFFKTTTERQLQKSVRDDDHGLKAKSEELRSSNRETIRLVRVRNPWGQKEWKGAWSADSERWTRSLRKQLCDSYSKGDGTFFMSFDDMLNRFHHMDVAKCRKVSIFVMHDELGRLIFN
jgi:hypothetical protein